MPEIKIAVRGADLVPISRLHIIQDDLKSLSKENYKKLRNEIVNHGFSYAIHVWDDGEKLCILDGTQRYRVVKEMCASEKFTIKGIPVNYVEASSERDAVLKCLGGAGMYGTPEDEGLYALMIKHNITPKDIPNIELPGIEMPSFEDNFFNDPEIGEEDEIPEPPKEAKSKRGEIYQLGNHRVMCGDSTSKEDVEKLMNGEKADMVFTDPPYGIGIDASYGDRMKGPKNSGLNDRAKKVYRNIIGDDKDFDPTFILQTFHGSKIFLWGANNYTEKLPKGQWFVWYKKITEGMKKMFGREFELCWTNQTAGQVYEHGWAGCLGHNNELDGATKTHPSMKSVQLILKIFKDYESESVWDGFLGSGSTLIACEKTNRKCYGMEIDPIYVDVIIARWEKFTGKTATKINGEEIERVASTGFKCPSCNFTFKKNDHNTCPKCGKNI